MITPASPPRIVKNDGHDQCIEAPVANKADEDSSRSTSETSMSSFTNLEDHINADRFIPQHKRLQWDTSPICIFMLGYPYLLSNNIGKFQKEWIRNPMKTRSSFDPCTFNIMNFIPECVQYILYCHNSSEIPFYNPDILLHPHIFPVQQTILQNHNIVKIMENKLNLTTETATIDTIKLQCRAPNSNTVEYNENRILQTTPETLAKVCDEIQTVTQENVEKGLTCGIQVTMELHECQKMVCKDYLSRTHILMDIERVQNIEDIKAYDLYSVLFDCIEIPPPREPEKSCPGCMKGKNVKGQEEFCAYHSNLLQSSSYSGMHSFSFLERIQGKNKPSIVRTENQFLCLQRNLDVMRRKMFKSPYCIIGHLTVTGIAENRPLVCVGDLLRLRFGQEEVIGEVLSLHIKTESIAIMLPIPFDLGVGAHFLGQEYLHALSNPKNKFGLTEEERKHLGRFDVRFGLYLSKAHDIFKETSSNVISGNISRVIRVLAPSTFLDKVQKKSIRRPHLGMAQWAHDLNSEQKHAVFDIVRKNHGQAPYIIYGPPGTGKTMTVCESVYQLLRHDENSKILVCAPSDAACDVIAKRLLPVLPSQNKILRINWWSRSVDSLPPSLLSCSPMNKFGFFTMPSRKKLIKASVIICQCFVAGCLQNETGSQLEKNWMEKHFTHVFIDESSQSFEFESLIPLFKVGERCSIILSGDPKQLGPTTRSTCAASHGLCMSLQERLMGLKLYRENSNFAVITKLLDNYRSHDALLRIPSELFYSGSLRCKASSEITSLCKDFELLRDGNNFPLMAYDVCNGAEQSKLDTPSFFNVEECEAIVKIIKALLSSPNVNIHAGQIAVITCFRAQVLKLRQFLRYEDLPSINVGVVEDFQGQETSVVLISTVLTKDHKRWKSGSKSGLGFMTDPKRFNVAITRASALCIIVGKVGFLELSGSYWASLIEHVRRNGGISGDSSLEDDENKDELEDYAIDQFVRRVEELNLVLGAGHETDRYELAMRGYYEDAPEWKVCL